MVRTVPFALVLALLAEPAIAAAFRFSGSAGAESRFTPADGDSPLNPGNAGEVPLQTNLADATFFGELVPESRRWKVKLKLRGEATDRGSDRMEAGEAFVQMQVRPWLDLAGGRVIEKWGTGYGWTPTAFVGPGRNPSDPNDRRAADRGLAMLRATAVVNETSLSAYALERGAFAARASRMAGATDLSLAVRRDGEHTRLGASFSRVIGEALEIHGELARTGNATTALVGGQITFANRRNVVLELIHDGMGPSSSEWTAFRDRVASATPPELMSANREYAPLRMGRDYAFLRLHQPFGDGDVDAELIAIASLRDGSTVLRATVSRTLRPNLNACLIATEFLAGEGSELDYAQVERVVVAGVRVWF